MCTFIIVANDNNESPDVLAQVILDWVGNQEQVLFHENVAGSLGGWCGQAGQWQIWLDRLELEQRREN